MNSTKARQAYDASMDAFRAEAERYRQAAVAYRARTIGDEEFLKAKAALKSADEASDAAEAALLKAEADARSVIAQFGLDPADPWATLFANEYLTEE